MDAIKLSESIDFHPAVNKSGEIPKIEMGPFMIDFGVDDEQVNRYIDNLMKILDYAQKNNLGVSWAR